jgi:hypothetical protein
MFNEIQGSGKHIAVVICSELFAGDAERGTRDACGKQVYAGKLLMPDVADVILNHIPMRPVSSQRGAILCLIFNCGGMMEASHLKTEGLTTTTSAKFKDSKTHL